MKEELLEDILEKITYMTGLFTGTANVLRSSGNIDPLPLSAEFASMAKDMMLLKDWILDLVDEEETISDEND